MANSIKRDKGAAMVEFAIILPLLLVLTFGILEFGRAFNQLIAIQGAAREAARAYSLDPAADVVSIATNSTAVGGLIVTPGVPCPADAVIGSTASASVTVKKPFTFMLPLLRSFNRDLAATATMRCGL